MDNMHYATQAKNFTCELEILLVEALPPYQPIYSHLSMVISSIFSSSYFLSSHTVNSSFPELLLVSVVRARFPSNECLS